MSAPRRRRPPGVRFRERHDPVVEHRRVPRQVDAIATARPMGAFRVGTDAAAVDHNAELLVELLSKVTMGDPHTAVTVTIGGAFLALRSAGADPVTTVRELLIAVSGVALALDVDFQMPEVTARAKETLQ